MPNQTIQYPNIDLPGAEYLSLAPNRTVAIQGRRRKVIGSTVTAIPSDGFGTITATAQIESGMTLTSGIYLHLMFGSYIPADNSGELQIGGLQAGFGANPAVLGDIGIRVGYPTTTVLSPIGVSGLLTQQDILVPYREVLFASGDTNTGLLSATLQLTMQNNDPSLPHSASVAMWIFYTRLDGLIYGE